jgi:ABC-type transport system substrate-binding protein
LTATRARRPSSSRTRCARWRSSIPDGCAFEDLYQRQARELDRKKREALLDQIQQIVHDRVMYVPIYELAFLWGIGPRVDEACVDRIRGFSYSAPYEDLTLKAAR